MDGSYPHPVPEPLSLSKDSCGGLRPQGLLPFIFLIAFVLLLDAAGRLCFYSLVTWPGDEEAGLQLGLKGSGLQQDLRMELGR